MYFLINFLTISRIILALVIFLLLTLPDKYIYALILFIFAGITDYFDGYLARKYELTSDIGEILDPIADKILVCFVLFGLSVNLSSYIVAFASATIISREIFVAALRDFNSRNDIANATKVTFLSKIKTSLQLFTITIYLIGLSLSKMLLIIFGDILLIISLLITIYTGFIYATNTINNIKYKL